MIGERNRLIKFSEDFTSSYKTRETLVKSLILSHFFLYLDSYEYYLLVPVH